MNGRITPQLGEYPVTIVAFMRETEDSLLLAADSQFTSGDIRMTKSKLRMAPNERIAWSSAGNPSIGLDEFGVWINTYDFNGKNWRSFAKDALRELSHLNGEQRKLTELSGVEYKPESMGAEALIAGWLDNKPGAYILREDGTSLNVLQDDFAAIGTGGRYATVAKWAIELCANQDKFATFKIVMRVVATHVQDCCLPIEACRIKKDAIERVFSFGE